MAAAAAGGEWVVVDAGGSGGGGWGRGAGSVSAAAGFGVVGDSGGGGGAGVEFSGDCGAGVFEEAGLRVREEDLVPFASLSEPEVHEITYPNGDRMHCFALCFEARVWAGEMRVEPEEVIEAGFWAVDEPPGELQPQTEVVLGLYQAYLATGHSKGGELPVRRCCRFEGAERVSRR